MPRPSSSSTVDATRSGPPNLATQGASSREAGGRARGRDAAAPWRIPLLGWKDIAWRTYRAIGRDRLPALSGGVTFFLLLAVFPALAAFVSVYGLFLDLGRVERQLDELAAILPREAVGLIGDQMVRLASRPGSTLGAAFAGSTLASIWSANAGMKALFDGLNVAYGETEKRPYLRRTLVT
jgi:membrane protein